MSGCVAGPAICSGNGYCNNSVCICNSDLFTGRSDWVNHEGQDCQILLPVIWAFWSLNLLEIIIVVIVAVPILRRLWLHHAKVRDHQRKKGHRYTIRDNFGLLSIFPFWVVSLPTHTALAIYKLSAREARLGLDLGMTILWMLSRISADLSASSSRAALTISTMQSEGASPGAIFKREMLISAFFFIAAASTMFVWPVYATGGADVNLAEGLFVAHFIVTAVCSAFYSYVSHRLNVSVTTNLMESYERLKDERIKQVAKDITRNQRLERNIWLMLSLAYLLLGSIPRLWSTLDYFWCTLWLVWPYLGLQNLIMLETAQRSARGDKERDRLIASLQLTSGGDRKHSITAHSSAADVLETFGPRWGWAFKKHATARQVSNSDVQ